MTKPSLKLLFLRKYRTSKKYYRQLRLPSTNSGTVLSFSGVFPSRSRGNSTDTETNASSRISYAGNRVVGSSNSQPSTRHKNVPIDTVDCCELICDCLSYFKFKLKTFLLIVVIGFISTAGIYFHNQRLLQYRLSNNTHINSTKIATSKPQSSIYDNSNNLTSSRPTSALKNLLLTVPQHLRQLNEDVEKVSYLNRVYTEDVFSPKHGIRLKRCTLPKLKPFAAEIKQFIGYTPRPNCVREQSDAFDDQVPFTLHNGTVLVRNPNLDVAVTKGCCYRPFFRNGDSNYW